MMILLRLQTASASEVWVWCCREWRAVAQLPAHTLTVTQLAWSSSGRLLAAVSRDRGLTVFGRTDPHQVCCGGGAGCGGVGALCFR